MMSYFMLNAIRDQTKNLEKKDERENFDNVFKPLI